MTVDSIQPLMRERLTSTVGTDVKRMMMAEQGRMVQKEFLYTGIYAALMYALTETNVCQSLFGMRYGAENAENHEKTDTKPHPTPHCDIGSLHPIKHRGAPAIA